MRLKIKLTDAGNTYNVAIHILKEQNYKIYSDSETDLLIAQYGELIFKSEDPLSLLSVVFLKNDELDEWHQSIHIDNYFESNQKMPCLVVELMEAIYEKNYSPVRERNILKCNYRLLGERKNLSFVKNKKKYE